MIGAAREVVALDEKMSSSPESSDRAVGRNAVVALAVVVAFVSGGFVGWFVGSRSDDSDATVPAESVELVEEWAQAVRDEDAERISKLYTEDAVWYDDALGDRSPGWQRPTRDGTSSA